MVLFFAADMIRQEIEAFLLGTHPRLGAASPVKRMPVEVLLIIFEYLIASHANSFNNTHMLLSPYHQELNAENNVNN